MPRFFHDKNSKCTRAVFAGRLSQPSGSLLSGASGAFHGFHPAAGLPAVLPQRIRKRKPRPIFRFGNLFRLRELPQRRQSPEGRRRIPLRRRGFSLRKRPRRRRNPGRMSKRLRTKRRGRFQAGERCRQPWTRKPRGRRAGKRSRTGPGSRITPLRQKNGLVPAGDQAVPGESSKKCLSFSKAA